MKTEKTETRVLFMHVPVGTLIESEPNMQDEILEANVGGFFPLNGTVYHIVSVYGACFQCYAIEEHGDSYRHVGNECLISARMVLGTVELFID